MQCLKNDKHPFGGIGLFFTELPKYAGKLLSKTLLRGREISSKMHLPSEDSWMEELLGFHKDFSVPIFRCTQAHLFFHPTSIYHNNWTNSSHFYRERNITTSLYWIESFKNTCTNQCSGKQSETGGKGGQIHTKDFFCALIATLSTRIGFDGFLPASPRGDIFSSYSRSDTEERKKRKRN